MARKTNAAKQLEIAERRARVAKLLKEGKSQEQIAMLVGVNQATVSRDVKSLIEEWKAAGTEDIKIQRGRIAQYLNDIIEFHHPRAIDADQRGRANIASARLVLQASRQLGEIFGLGDNGTDDKESVASVLKDLLKEADKHRAARTQPQQDGQSPHE